MKIYNYNPFTKIFLNEGVADKNQLNPSEYILPAFCTTIQPPSVPQGKSAYWTGLTWEIRNTPQPQFEPEIIESITWDSIRSNRNYYLSQTDWVFTPDAPVQDKQPWLDYRQALRNIPQTFVTPESVVWPTKP